MSNRIVSLIASSTEIVHALGFGHEMVGRSHECDYPASVLDLPVCTEPKFQVDGSSYEIDQRVKAIVQESLSVYKVKADMVDGLRPTHIITQAQCEVCAVSLRDVEEAACQFIGSHPQIVSLEPNSLADIFADVKRVASALGAEQAGEKLIKSMKRRIEEVTVRASESTGKKISVACIEWIEPLMAAGNWMPQLVELAGGVNLFGESGKHSPWMTFEQLVERDPDVIIVTPCGFGIERTKQEMHILQNNEHWPKLKAVKNGEVYVADGNQYFNRPGPRVVESLEIMAEILYPDVFSFGYEGTGWVFA